MLRTHTHTNSIHPQGDEIPFKSNAPNDFEAYFQRWSARHSITHEYRRTNIIITGNQWEYQHEANKHVKCLSMKQFPPVGRAKCGV